MPDMTGTFTGCLLGGYMHAIRDRGTDRAGGKERLPQRACVERTGTLGSVLLIASVLVLLLAPLGHTYEREILLSEEYQTPGEKQALRDRFTLNVAFGYGVSYAASTGLLLGLSPDQQVYFDRLGLQFSESVFPLRLTASYALSPKLGVYLAVPFGAVNTREEEGLARLFEEDKIKFGVGDVFGGVSYTLLSEAEKQIWPNIVVSFDVNSDVTKFVSLGDGLWDLTWGIALRKFVFPSFYLLGLSDYTYRVSKNGVAPGDIIGYGGGIGYAAQTLRVEAVLKAQRIGETQIDNRTILNKDTNLIFILRVLSSFGSVSLTLGNLDQGISTKRTDFGIEYSLTIL